MQRRVVAIVVRELCCDLVRQRVPGAPASLAVILEPGALPGTGAHPSLSAAFGPSAGEVSVTATLDVVSDAARRYGVRPGQKVTEATALTTGLAIHRVTIGEVEAALGRIAEVALALGTTAAIRLDSPPSHASGPGDTVWLDITGTAHLFGGEEALAIELHERVAALGHRARVAVAGGPRVAQALARHAAVTAGVSGMCTVVAEGDEAAAMAPLPIYALPVDAEVHSFLVRVGLLTVGDLARLPRAAAAARLSAAGKSGAQAAGLALAVAAGVDPSPLVVFEPARELEEAAAFEEPVESAEALLFVLRGMTSRLGARLGARGEAAGRIEACIVYDRSIARLRTPAGQAPPLELELAIDLPSPLADAADLLRPLRAKLERAELLAPAVGVVCRIPQIARARRVQLDLSRNRAASPDALPALLAELSAEIGADRLGVLEVADAHRPELRSRLAAVDDKRARRAPPPPGAPVGPTRLLPQPVSLGRFARGAVAMVDRQLFTIEDASFVMRLDGVEWWTDAPVSRDYLRARLVSSNAVAEGWVWVDRQTGEGWLQGWCE